MVIEYTNRKGRLFKIIVDDDFKCDNIIRVSGQGDHLYAVTSVNKKPVLLHRLICNAPNNMVVDHINHNTLDNRKDNLRLTTKSQNQWNRLPQVSKSGYKGVHIYKDGRIRAEIKINGKKIILGDFTSVLDAAKAYCNAAKIYHNEYNKYTVDYML